MSKSSLVKIMIALCIGLVLVIFFQFDLGRFLSLEYVQSRLSALQTFRNDHFALALAIYFLTYLLIAALSIPGALIITLTGGAIFGLIWGTVLASFASSIGATLAFLLSRTLLRNWVQSRFGNYLAPINRGIEQDGNFYLFSIRMVPIFPFFVVNLLMGLTPIGVIPFYLVSQIGMLLITAVYVNAGSELAQITSLSGLVSPSVILSLVLVGVSPLAAKLLINAIKRARK